MIRAGTLEIDDDGNRTRDSNGNPTGLGTLAEALFQSNYQPSMRDTIVNTFSLEKWVEMTRGLAEYSNKQAGAIIGKFNAQIRITKGANANSTYQAATPHIIVPASWLSADREYVLGDDDAQEGDRIRITNHDTVRKVTVKRSGGSIICELRDAAGFFGWVEVVRWNGSWTIETFFKQ
jgi:hypothetical protein